MVLTDNGRKKLSDLEKTRERNKSGRFLPMGMKYVYDMSYIKRGASHKTSSNEKWTHVRVTQYSKKKLDVNDFRRIADRKKPYDCSIPHGSREKSFEAYMDLKYSRKQAEREEIDDGEPHIEEYTGKGGGLRDT